MRSRIPGISDLGHDRDRQVGQGTRLASLGQGRLIYMIALASQITEMHASHRLGPLWKSHRAVTPARTTDGPRQRSFNLLTTSPWRSCLIAWESPAFVGVPLVVVRESGVDSSDGIFLEILAHCMEKNAKHVTHFCRGRSARCAATD